MIFENTSLKMSLQFICLCAMFCFQAPVFNAIPFMYYRSDLSCKIDGEWQPCQEEQICDNNYEFQFVNKNGMESITMDYGLVCEKRLQEATILSVGFAGQLLAYVVAVLHELPKSQKTTVLFLLCFIEGLLLNSIAFIKGSIMYVTIVIFIWNFGFSYVYSQIFTFSGEMYTPAIKTQSVSILNISWTGGALLFILYSQLTADWINHVAYFGGMTVWIFSACFYLLRSPPPEPESLADPFLEAKRVSAPRKSEKEEAKEHQQNFIEDLANKFKELKANKKYSMNAIIFILAWTIFQTSYATPFIAFNTLGGNLQQNVFVSILFDFIGSFIAYYLLLKYDSMRLLLNNLLIIGVLQTLAFFVPVDSFALQIIPILATKLSTRIGYPTLLTLLPFVLPAQFTQIVFNIANMISIIVSTGLPFYRYFMEQQGLNIFAGVGVITLLIIPVAVNFKTIDSGTEIKTARASIKKKSSFGYMKRNSDALIEGLLQRTSLISQNAAMMMIDKAAATEEKKQQNIMKGNLAYNQQSQELATIQEKV